MHTRVLKVFANSLLGFLFAVIGFSIYASFIHNQYFSTVAKIESKIKTGESCRDVYAKLEQYRNTDPNKVFIKESPPDISKWKDNRNINSIILLSDDSTPFDMIRFQVFCGKNDKVLGTYLVGD